MYGYLQLCVDGLWGKSVAYSGIVDRYCSNRCPWVYQLILWPLQKFEKKIYLYVECINKGWYIMCKLPMAFRDHVSLNTLSLSSTIRHLLSTQTVGFANNIMLIWFFSWLQLITTQLGFLFCIASLLVFLCLYSWFPIVAFSQLGIGPATLCSIQPGFYSAVQSSLCCGVCEREHCHKTAHVAILAQSTACHQCRYLQTRYRDSACVSAAHLSH